MADAGQAPFPSKQPTCPNMLAVLTVGSTEFTSLVHAALDDAIIAALQQKSFNRYLLQVGNSVLPDHWPLGRSFVRGLEIDVVAFVPDIETRMAEASLVVCHAGAGSILSALRGPIIPLRDKLPVPHLTIVVPNTSLMDNHQMELSKKLSDMGAVQACDERGLLAAVQRFQPDLLPNTNPQPRKPFAAFLDDFTGQS